MDARHDASFGPLSASATVLLALLAGCSTLPPKLTKIEDERRGRALFKKQHGCETIERVSWEVDCVLRLRVSGCGKTAHYHLLHSGWSPAESSGVHEAPCRVVVGDSGMWTFANDGSFWVAPQLGPYHYKVQVPGVACSRESRKAREQLLAGQRLTLMLGEDPESVVGSSIGPVRVNAQLEDGSDVAERFISEGICTQVPW